MARFKMIIVLSTLSIVFTANAMIKNDDLVEDLQDLSNNQPPQTNETVELIMERLPRVAEFNSYNISIFPHVPFGGVESSIDDFTFDGNVTIEFTIINDTDRFFFYSKDLTINQIGLENDDGTAIPIEKWDVDKNLTLGFVQPAEKFQINKTYQIHFQFKGELANATVSQYFGLFYRYYKESGKEFYTVATHLSTLSGSRKMFPSGDDPHFKSVFYLSVIYPKTATIFSNSMPEKEEDYDETHKIVKFKKSPVMSSYLLAFAFGTYEVRESKSKSGVPIGAAFFNSTIPPADMDHALKTVLNISTQCLDTMEDLLKVPYPHTKLDHVHALAQGGMENFGMITYQNLFEILASEAKFVPILVCHETSHSWFGNLVTNDNWGQIFLHESFAIFFQFQAVLHGNIVDDLDSVKSFMLQFRVQGFNATLGCEHPLVTETRHYDNVIGSAGSAILRMIEGAFGSEKFYAALKLYLETNKFGTATHEDLILAFEQTLNNQTLCGDLSIREFLLDFFLQTYFPVVSVDVKDNEYQFEQKSAQQDDKGTWNVPMFIQELNETSSTQSTVQTVWLLKNNSLCSKTVQLPLKADKQYNFNTEFRAFAKINETDEHSDDQTSVSLMNMFKKPMCY